ncbi:hypothetical protein BC827DRAFT_716671 [Russula dissimulans]|nr:hypothetical protein BC827DRAFT_716671 [Russula dissimulans]
MAVLPYLVCFHSQARSPHWLPSRNTPRCLRRWMTSQGQVHTCVLARMLTGKDVLLAMFHKPACASSRSSRSGDSDSDRRNDTERDSHASVSPEPHISPAGQLSGRGVTMTQNLRWTRPVVSLGSGHPVPHSPIAAASLTERLQRAAPVEAARSFQQSDDCFSYSRRSTC